MATRILWQEMIYRQGIVLFFDKYDHYGTIKTQDSPGRLGFMWDL